MAGHARLPGDRPGPIASQSEPVIDGLLRDELGFEGVVITDSTEAAAVQEVTGVQEAAVRNIRAGVDIVLTTGRGSYIQVYRALLAEARRDPEFRERVQESAARVVALQDRCSADPVLALGDPVPPFTLPDTEGTEHRVPARGRPRPPP